MMDEIMLLIKSDTLNRLKGYRQTEYEIYDNCILRMIYKHLDNRETAPIRCGGLLFKGEASLRILKITDNTISKFIKPDESSDEFLNRIMDLEDESPSNYDSIEMEYRISRGNAKGRFKIHFGSAGINSVGYKDLFNGYDSNIHRWDIQDGKSEDENALKRFMVEFLEDNRNLILLEVMGSRAEFDDIIIERL